MDDTDHAAELGLRIEAWRQYKRLTQRQLAAKLGISQGAIAQWESGLTSPSARHLNEMLDAFDVTVQEFYRRIPKTAKAS